MDKSPGHTSPGAQSAEGQAALRRELATLLPELRAYARFLARDRSKSDDLVQDTVVRALGHWRNSSLEPA